MCVCESVSHARLWPHALWTALLVAFGICTHDFPNDNAADSDMPKRCAPSAAIRTIGTELAVVKHAETHGV
jgi:hypothetical protein